jgi:hypothetical protein
MNSLEHSAVTEHPLLAQLGQIDRTLLGPVKTAPPDLLTSEERSQTRAFLLLAHALLEEAIETIFLSHFRDASAIIASGKAVPTELLPFYASVLEWGSEKLPTYAKRKWLGFISSQTAEEHVTNVVRKNHGLKEDNVKELAKLVGIEWAVIDDAPGIELGALTTLGVKRGVAGHTSLFSGLNQSLLGEEYPVNVREWVEQAAKSVIELEAVISRLSTPPSITEPSPAPVPKLPHKRKRRRVQLRVSRVAGMHRCR